jgi:hypothetical protein
MDFSPGEVPLAKPEREFFNPEVIEWTRPSGYPDGVWEKILAWDEQAGVRTRLLRFEPGAGTAAALIHDHWEEVYIISGGLMVGDTSYTQGMVAIRPPGMPHGPFRAPGGCMTFEVHYYSR